MTAPRPYGVGRKLDNGLLDRAGVLWRSSTVRKSGQFRCQPTLLLRKTASLDLDLVVREGTLSR